MKHGLLNSPTDGHRVTGAAMPRPNVANMRQQMPGMPPANGKCNCNCNGNQDTIIAKNNYPSPPSNMSLPMPQGLGIRQLPTSKSYGQTV